jgi:hypothetical protein
VSENDARDEQEQRPAYPGGAPGDDVDEERLRWLASQDETPEPEQPPVSPADAEPAEPPPDRPNRRAECIRAVVLFFVVVILGAGIWHTYAVLGRADAALKQTAINLGGLAGSLVPPNQVATITQRIYAHDYDQVVTDLQQLALLAAKPGAGAAPAPGGLAPGLPGPLESDVGDKLTPAAEKFFNGHRDLMEEWLGLAKIGRALKAKGIDMTEFRALRDQALKAADKGDADTVLKLARQFEDRVRAVAPDIAAQLGGDKAAPPPELDAKLQSLKPVLEKAASERKDIRQAMRLITDAKTAASQGDYKRASDLLDAAKRAAEQAPRMAAGPGMMRRHVRMPTGPGAGRGPGPLQALDLLMRMVKAEESDLSGTYETLENAQTAVREQNQDQIGEMISEARAILKHIAERRHEVSALLTRGMEGPPGQPGRHVRGHPVEPGPGPTPGPAPAARSVPDRIGDLLEGVRKMQDRDFEAQKGDLVAQVFAMFLPPEPTAQTKPVPAAEIERIRAKLRLAYGPYAQRKKAGEDMIEIDKLFRDARSALYAGDTVQSNKLVDQALVELGLMKEPGAAPAPVTPSGAEAPR